MWAAADILRGSLDASEYRMPVITILFLKRLNDRFEENVENLIKQGKSEKEANQQFRHDFFVPKEAMWRNLSQTRSKVGEKIDEMCRILEKANPKLDGVLTNTKYADPRKYPDDVLAKLVSHYNQPRLRNSDLTKEDIFGDAYEYLLEQFADATKKKGGEFFTPREVVKLLVNLVEPKQFMKRKNERRSLEITKLHHSSFHCIVSCMKKTKTEKSQLKSQKKFSIIYFQKQRL